MKIYVKQIDEASLTAFVTGVAGTSLSGQLNSYLQNGGYLGVNVVYASGGTQIISGNKNFDSSPGVPYSGNTGTAPSRLYVDNQITLALANSNLSLSGSLAAISGNINASGRRAWDDATNLSGMLVGSGAVVSFLSVTGSSGIQFPNLSGIGGTLVLRSGNFVLISGASSVGGSVSNSDGINLSGNLNASGRRAWDDATNLSGRLSASGTIFISNDLNLSGGLFATGAALSAVKVTGSSTIQSPNFTGLGGTIILQSGSFVLISGGGGGNSTVSVTGSNPLVAPNFSGIGGTSVIQSGNFVLISGGSTIGGTVITTNNTFNITGTGTINNTFNASGSISNTFIDSSTIVNNSLITGLLVNMAFYFDQYNMATGLNLVEAYTSQNFILTGYALGLLNSGMVGNPLSGAFYQRTLNNTKSTVLNFIMNIGTVSFVSGGLSNPISGLNRVGVDLTNIPTGATGLSLGLFGIGF